MENSKVMFILIFLLIICDIVGKFFGVLGILIIRFFLLIVV